MKAELRTGKKTMGEGARGEGKVRVRIPASLFFLGFLLVTV